MTPEQAFAARARRDRNEIEALWQTLAGPAGEQVVQARLQRLEDLAHGLYGAGGTFGFDEISRIAGELELLLEACRLKGYSDWPAQSTAAVAMIPPLLAVLDSVGPGAA